MWAKCGHGPLTATCSKYKYCCLPVNMPRQLRCGRRDSNPQRAAGRAAETAVNCENNINCDSLGLLCFVPKCAQNVPTVRKVARTVLRCFRCGQRYERQRWASCAATATSGACRTCAGGARVPWPPANPTSTRRCATRRPQRDCARIARVDDLPAEPTTPHSEVVNASPREPEVDRDGKGALAEDSDEGWRLIQRVLDGSAWDDPDRSGM
jgi:hypothetical protein